MSDRVAITGAAGRLGRELVRAFGEAGAQVHALTRDDFDVTLRSDLQRLSDLKPDLVINAAAWTDVDGCALHPARAMRINGTGAGAVAAAAAAAGARIVQISTNEVFDGAQERPYTEDDRPNPINPYGGSKLAGERLVADATGRHLIIRTAWLFGPDTTSFVTKIRGAAMRAIDARGAVRVVVDEWGNPTPIAWLADAIRSATLNGVHGILHLAGSPAVSRYEWAEQVTSGMDVSLVGISRTEFLRSSLPPARAVLDLSRAEGLGIPAGNWRAATAELVRAA